MDEARDFGPCWAGAAVAIVRGAFVVLPEAKCQYTLALEL